MGSISKTIQFIEIPKFVVLAVISTMSFALAMAQVDVDKSAFNLIDADEGATFNGDLQQSIPVLTVPGVDGLDFPIVINFKYDTRPERRGTWVGLNWNLQVGSIARSVNNLPDDQSKGVFNLQISEYSGFNLSGAPNTINWGIGYAENDGIFMQSSSGYDYFDSYYLIMPQGAHKITPSIPAPNFDTFEFETERWQPWRIGFDGQIDWDGTTPHTFTGGWNLPQYLNLRYIRRWQVETDEGRAYLFDHRNYVRFTSPSNSPDPFQLNGSIAKYAYPVSWDLTVIKSASYVDRNSNSQFDNGDDGGWVVITYNNYAHKLYGTGGPTGNGFMVDESPLTGDVSTNVTLSAGFAGFSPPGQATFGKTSSSSYPGDIWFDYSCVDAIETPTHIAVFEVSDREDLKESVLAGTPLKAKKLSSVTLYRKIGSNRSEWTSPENRVSRVVFNYSYVQPGNQYLVLNSMQQFGRNDIEFDQIPKYKFSNPLANPWRITHPEGGYEEYQMEDDVFKWYFTSVNDRMGNGQFTFQSPFTCYFFQNPRNGNIATNYLIPIDATKRILTKTAVDQMGLSTLQTFSYGDGVLSNSDIASWQRLISNMYSAWHNGNIGYRWVQSNRSDGSRTRMHFTSPISTAFTPYEGGAPSSLPMPAESYPDLGVSGSTIKFVSNAGLSGIVWLEEYSNPTQVVKRVEHEYPLMVIDQSVLISESNTRTYYANDLTHRFIFDDLFFSDAGTVDDLPPFVRSMFTGLSVRVAFKSAWLRKKSETTTVDGVSSKVEYPIGDYNKVNSQPTIVKALKSVGATTQTRLTKTTFAYEKYGFPFTFKNMTSQKYMTVVYEGAVGATNARHAEVQTWSDFDPTSTLRTYPDQTYVWRETGPSVDFSGDSDESLVLVRDVNGYDAQGNLQGFVDSRNTSFSNIWGYSGARMIASFRNTNDLPVGAWVFDDYNLSGWSTTNGTWSIDGGTYYQSHLGTLATTWDNPRNYLNQFLSDCVVEGDIKIEYPTTSSEGLAGLTKFIDQNNFVRFELHGRDGYVRIVAKKSGVTFQSSTAIASIGTALNHLRGEIEGNVARLYFNGRLLLSVSDPNIFISSGRVGLPTYDAKVRFDNLRFHGVGAQGVLYTYDPIILELGAKSDENGVVANYEYDNLARLCRVKDGLGVLLKQFEYYYSRLGDQHTPNETDEFDPEWPNRITERGFRATGTDFVEKRLFYDGLGYERQQQTSYWSEDIVNSVVYDNVRHRAVKQSKPFQYQFGFPHKYVTAWEPLLQSYYERPDVVVEDVNVGPYTSAETEYYPDPLNRVKRQSAPGSVFRLGGGHDISFEYGGNLSSDVPGYSANQLFKTTTTDENGNVSHSFLDQFGKRVAETIDPTGLHLQTQLRYNIVGNLVESLPPVSSVSSATYTHNTLRHLMSKSSPDNGSTLYLYDRNGNLRFKQDAKQSTMGKFTFRRYDSFDRVIEVGEYSGALAFTQGNADACEFPPDSDPNKNTISKFAYEQVTLPGQQYLVNRLATVLVYKQGSEVERTYYSYDRFGGVEWLLHKNPGLSDKKICYWYNLQGDVTKKCVGNLASSSYNLYTFYEYDYAGRLSKVFTNTADQVAGRVKDAEYTYFADGSVKRLQLGNAQGVDYRYNERGWLKQINHQNLGGIYNGQPQDPGRDGFDSGLPVDKFGMVVGYNTQSHIGAPIPNGQNATPQFNGNINWEMHNIAGLTFQGSPLVGQTFAYDPATRLIGSNFGYYGASGWLATLAYDLPALQYDDNGNIGTLHRNNQIGNALDRFAYLYVPNTNRLTSITNTASGTQVYNYSYDANGNMTSDSYRTISNVTYDINNLPLSLLSNGTTVNYSYDASGNRIRKQHGSTNELYVLGADGQTEAVYGANGAPLFFNVTNGKEAIGKYTSQLPIAIELATDQIVGVHEAEGTITASVAVEEDKHAELKAGDAIVLKHGFRVPLGSTLEARIVPRTASRYYYLKDHLGSIRVTVDQVGTVKGYDDYDPWGMQLAGRSGNFGLSNDKYKFTGKERDVETGVPGVVNGYDYFGARYYDARIGRWLSVDPLAEKYPAWSPYNYVLNSPLTQVDNNGKWPTYIHHALIQSAFNGINQSIVNRYKDASDWVDTKEYQRSNMSYMHAMRMFDLDENEGIAAIDKYLNEPFEDALAKGPDFDFGAKLHVIVDMTSPRHVGVQKWGGNPQGRGLPELMHVLGELNITTREFFATVRLMKKFEIDYKAWLQDPKKNKLDFKKYQNLFEEYMQQDSYEEREYVNDIYQRRREELGFEDP